MTSARYNAVGSTARWISAAALWFGVTLISSGGQAQVLQVQDVDSHGGITDFAYIVNLDNTADPNDADPRNHPGEHPMASYSPIVAAGDEGHTTIVGADGQPLPSDCLTDTDPPQTRPCRYLVSVRAPGYKLWGAHFTKTAGGPASVLVELKHEPLPLSKLVVKVFEDFAPVNGFPDFPLEIGPEGGAATTDMSGFQIVIEDILGQVSVDFNGDPICGNGHCLTDAEGNLTIENLGFGKYEVYAIPPSNAQQWVQTTTFEGTRAVDAWLEEGSDGLGAPREILAEPFVQTAHFFGFTRAMSPPGGGGSVTGRIRNYVEFPPFAQLAIGEPVNRPWIAVTDIGATDTQVARVRGNADGTFQINGLPPGTYQLAVWDDFLDYIMNFYTVVIPPGGGSVDLGDLGIFRWFGWLSGSVFFDNDCNIAANPPDPDCGIKGPSDTGVPNFDLDVRNRDATIAQATFTDNSGHYEFPELLSPMGKFMIGEVGFGRFGLTGQSLHNELFSNMPDQFADSVTPIAGNQGGDLLTNQLTLEGHRSIVDWGKRNYATNETGQIVGITFYDTTRNEFDARLEVAEDYTPAIPNVLVRLWGLGADGLANTADDVLLNEYITDKWQHPNASQDPPNGCDVMDKEGNPVPGVTPNFVADNCIEVPMIGNETKDGAFDGGYAFAATCAITAPGGGPILAGPVRPKLGQPWPAPSSINEDIDNDGIPNTYETTPLFDPDTVDCTAPLTPRDYVVQVVPPPYYQITAEEDVNVDEGNQLQNPPPLILPPPCAGDMHTVNDTGGDIISPYNGTDRRLCDKRRVTLAVRQNANSDFFLFTDMDTDPWSKFWSTDVSVPPAGRFFGLIEDDLDLNTDPNSITYGEKRSVEGAPVGVRDYSFRLLKTIYADENGFYEVLIPSTFSMFCPVPGGVCPGMYVLTVNDPGNPASPDPAFRPSYLTEPAVFEVWPGKMTPTDTPIDPVETGAFCQQNVGTPELLQVSRVQGSNAANFNVVITGVDFGLTTQPAVTLAGTALANVSYVPGSSGGPFVDVVTVRVPAGFPAGPHQLLVKNAETGKTSVAGITIHVTGAGYSPPIVNVNPPANPSVHVIQNAINSAAAGSLIIVHPGTYRENVILHKAVKLQGYGPGGAVGSPESEFAGSVPPGEDPFTNYPGTVIDGRYFTFDESIRTAWQATLTGPASPFGGPPTVPGGAAVTVVANPGEFDAPALGGFKPQIDGFGITAARGFGGGGIHVHAYGRNLQISNNILDRNQSAHGGAVAIGRPVSETGNATTDNNNDGVGILHNRILRNGGVRFAGAVGVFNGADNYEIGYNDFCGNASSEYGGGISHFGLSQNGHIHHNRVYYNDAFDEGGGIQIAGDQFPTLMGVGSGDVLIEDNLIQANKSNDDGGGISLLRPLTYRVDIVNNIIVNNVAADFGGGIFLDDASNVTVVNNTIAANASTSTAEDRDLSSCNPPPGSGISCPHAAGLISTNHSAEFQATLPSGAPTFSDPVIFNNIFWQNEAFFYDPSGGPPDSGLPPNLPSAGFIDLEVFGTSTPEVLSPKYSLLTVAYAGADGTNIVGQDPLFVAQEETDPVAVPSRLNPSEIIIEYLRITVLSGDYHLQLTSPAINAGTFGPIAGVLPPVDDFDGDVRPFPGSNVDIGADEAPVGPATPPVVLLFFSTAGNTAVPGVAGPYDDADIYRYSSDGTYARVFDASVAGLPGNANVDALYVVDADTFYVSFTRDLGTTVPGGVGVVQDEDIVRYDAGTWSLYFDGSDVGLGSDPDAGLAGEDVDAFTILSDGSVLVSTTGGATVTGLAGTFPSQDLLRCVGSFGATTTCTWTQYFDGSDVGLTLGSENIDDVTVFVSGGTTTNVVLSTTGDFSVAGLSGQNVDVFACRTATTGSNTACGGGFSLYFDGSAHGLANNIDAFHSTSDPTAIVVAGVTPTSPASSPRRTVVAQNSVGSAQ